MSLVTFVLRSALWTRRQPGSAARADEMHLLTHEDGSGSCLKAHWTLQSSLLLLYRLCHIDSNGSLLILVGLYFIKKIYSSLCILLKMLLKCFQFITEFITFEFLYFWFVWQVDFCYFDTFKACFNLSPPLRKRFLLFLDFFTTMNDGSSNISKKE